MHPAKTEVRFKDAGLIRSMIVGGLRAALAEAAPRLDHGGGKLWPRFAPDIWGVIWAAIWAMPGGRAILPRRKISKRR